MELLKRLFSMPSFAGSTNALLVELTLPTLTDSQRTELKARVIEFLKHRSAPSLSLEAVMAELNQASRVTQLNLLALAMRDLGYKPAITTERFRKIKDPFAPDLVDEHALRAVARRLKWTHGIDAHMEEEPINFDSW